MNKTEILEMIPSDGVPVDTIIPQRLGMDFEIPTPVMNIYGLCQWFTAEKCTNHRLLWQGYLDCKLSAEVQQWIVELEDFGEGDFAQGMREFIAGLVILELEGWIDYMLDDEDMSVMIRLYCPNKKEIAKLFDQEDTGLRL